MRNATVLAIDDEEGVHYSFKRLFPPEITLHSALTGDEGVSLARTLRPDVALIDLKLPDMSGLDLLEAVQKVSPRTTIIIMTAYATGKTTMEAMARGAFDFVTKPFDLPLLLGRIDEAVSLARYRRGAVILAPDAADVADTASPEDIGDTLIGMSPAMANVYKLIGRLAPTNETVLISGESGTGKELVARAIVQHSGRADRPYIAINCAAFPETLLEAELFGYEKGAFTGATERRSGKFEACDKGTILLDEIGDMPLSLQAKLLRVLQEKEVTRLGATAPIKLDIRILAATHKDLLAESNAGRFRRDLFYRLTPATIPIPPLRDRKEDLPVLVQHLVARICADHRRSKIPKISPKVLKKLADHHWPGNVRELENALRQAILCTSGDTLHFIETQAYDTDESDRLFRQLFDHLAASGPDLLGRVQDVFSKMALDRTNGNITAAAKLLGLSRNTLKKNLGDHGDGD